MDDSQVKHIYYMILGNYILSEFKIDLYFSDNKIRVNGGAQEGCNASMEGISDIHFNMSYNWINKKYFGKKSYGRTKMC